MTFGIAWTYKNVAYLVADTAISEVGNESKCLSSFGEGGVSGVCIEDVAQKMYVLSDHCAVAVSSHDFSFAIKLVVFLEERMESLGGLQNSLDVLQATFGPFDAKSYTELVVAENLNGVASIWYWNTHGAQERKVEGFFEVGSLSGHESLTSLHIVMDEWMSKGKPTDGFVQVVSVCLQMMGVHNNYWEHGVGGLFFGLSVHADGIRWQPDTTYIVYPPNLLNASEVLHVGAIAREGALFIASSLSSGAIKMLTMSLGGEEVTSVLERLTPIVTKVFSGMKFTLWCFISKKYSRVLILHAMEGGGPPPFRVNLRKGDGFEFIFANQFLASLNRPFEPAPSYSSSPVGFDSFEYRCITNPVNGDVADE